MSVTFTFYATEVIMATKAKIQKKEERNTKQKKQSINEEINEINSLED